jgi:DNA (cytosine-5)-methyltransferase 1
MKSYTFIDLFAGAGGFSEGFLQVEKGDSNYEFLLASDINENCELTHLARYNRQLGLDIQFVRMDARDDAFVDTILARLRGREVDVVCGGPPCQSFSLAGRRRRNDKKDQLFEAYLRVIRALRPKYFVMENVTGILTKDNGAFKRAIIRGIESILDETKFPELRQFVHRVIGKNEQHKVLISILRERVVADGSWGNQSRASAKEAVELTTKYLRELTATRLQYKTSKTDERVLTIRHALRLLANHDKMRQTREHLSNLKSLADIDNDRFVAEWDAAAALLDIGCVIDRAIEAADDIPELSADSDLVGCLEALGYTAAESLDELSEYCDPTLSEDFSILRSELRHYNLVGPQVLDAADHGVPQQRLRAVFVGCRKEQIKLSLLAPTVSKGERLCVHEAIHDLNFLQNGERAQAYRASEPSTNGHDELNTLLHMRTASGLRSATGKMYSDWCRDGRLAHLKVTPSAYYSSLHDYEANTPVIAELHNHEVSKHSDVVEKRLAAIQRLGSYEGAAEYLNAAGLGTAKRDYTLLVPEKPSPTIMTIADDYIHPNKPRALTVREMARLQSFDDSFVFQGKRTTGGDRRKDEVPQFTLVGNAVPPLLARAIAAQILEALEKGTHKGRSKVTAKKGS